MSAVQLKHGSSLPVQPQPLRTVILTNFDEPDALGPDEEQIFSEDTARASVVFKGRLRSNITFWQKIGASKWVIDIISSGYCLPFVEEPVSRKFFKNNNSTQLHADFVLEKISKLSNSGALSKSRN